MLLSLLVRDQTTLPGTLRRLLKSLCQREEEEAAIGFYGDWLSDIFLLLCWGWAPPAFYPQGEGLGGGHKMLWTSRRGVMSYDPIHVFFITSCTGMKSVYRRTLWPAVLRITSPCQWWFSSHHHETLSIWMGWHCQNSRRLIIWHQNSFILDVFWFGTVFTHHETTTVDI